LRVIKKKKKNFGKISELAGVGEADLVYPPAM